MVTTEIIVDAYKAVEEIGLDFRNILVQNIS